jgi:hypothetical protein
MESRIPTPLEFVSSEKIEIVGPPDETNSVDDGIEILKATYDDEISKIHEYYQYIIRIISDVIIIFIFRTEIHRLTKLLNKVFSGETIDTSELDEDTFELIEESRQPPKREVVYGKDLPKKVILNLFIFHSINYVIYIILVSRSL